MLMYAAAGMDAGVSGKVIIAAAEPCLNVIQSVSSIQHHGGAAMPEIVETDFPESVLPQDLLELLWNIVRLQHRL